MSAETASTPTLNAKSGVYSGNVLVSQGEMKLRADTVRVNTTAGKPDKIFANGNVVFNAPNGTARATRASTTWRRG